MKLREIVNMEYIHHCRSPLGDITMASDGEALTGLWFDGQKYFEDGLDADHQEKKLPVFEQAEQWLDMYFSGRDPGFTPPLRMKTTAFRKEVWEILLSIPYGETMTYGEIARRIAEKKELPKMSARAVGGAAAHNPISLIIPCHRVTGADGRLTGYAGGTDRKARLLAMERNSRMHMEKIRERGVLRVGTAGDYPPMSFLDADTGHCSGFDAELANDLAYSLNVGIEYVRTSWPSLTDDTIAGRFDLAVGGITVTDERKKQALMSEGYLENGKTILCRAEDTGRFTGIKAINRAGVRVVVNPGGLNEQFARDHLPEAERIVHAVNTEIPGLVVSGKADVMITETVEAGYYAGQDDRLAAPLVRKPFTHGELGILMPKGSEDLLQYVNAFLKKEKESGRIRELAGKYLSGYRTAGDTDE